MVFTIVTLKVETDSTCACSSQCMVFDYNELTNKIYLTPSQFLWTCDAQAGWQSDNMEGTRATQQKLMITDHLTNKSNQQLSWSLKNLCGWPHSFYECMCIYVIMQQFDYWTLTCTMWP